MEEVKRNENSFFNPFILLKPQNPDIQPNNNVSRWIQLPNEEPLFTNERLTFQTLDIFESNAMGELRASGGTMENASLQAWTFHLDICLDFMLDILLNKEKIIPSLTEEPPTSFKV